MTAPVPSPSVAEVLAGLVEEARADLCCPRTPGWGTCGTDCAVLLARFEALEEAHVAALGRHGAASVAARCHPAMRLEHGEGGLVTVTCACGVSTTLANNRAAIDWWRYHDAVLAAVPSSPDHGAPTSSEEH